VRPGRGGRGRIVVLGGEKENLFFSAAGEPATKRCLKEKEDAVISLADGGVLATS